MFLSTLYVQQELQLSPARASSAFPVFNIAVVGGSLLAPTLLRRLGAPGGVGLRQTVAQDLLDEGRGGLRTLGRRAAPARRGHPRRRPQAAVCRRQRHRQA